ncbi:MAG: CD1247 N-terminal domain-containing protein [Clostridium sp.]|uniref:CD1247 N-terminal domain-containing protein n=1 Tax=Clostridium sp. TaxID=1506 RepID=UPI003EE7997A
MKELRNDIELVKKEILKKDDEISLKLANILEKLVDRVEEIQVNQEAMDESIRFMDTDISGIQDELFEELSFEDLEDVSDEYEEVHCVHCSKPIFMEKDMLQKNEEIECPYCKKNIFK